MRRGTPSSRVRSRSPGWREPVVSPAPVSPWRWPAGSTAVDMDGWGIGDVADMLEISHRSAQRGFHAAERARLLSADRPPGCKPIIAVLDGAGGAAESGRMPLYGPVPWRWWLLASRLPGKALQTAA